MPYRTANIELDYDGPVIRPPLESRSLILQVTVGCSHNKCRYCPAFKMKRFKIKDLDIVLNDIETAKPYGYPCVFLADGDALIMPTPRLLSVLEAIVGAGLGSERISTYANVKSIKRRSDDELATLREAGLKRLYIGLESGCDQVLSMMNKGITSDQTRRESRRAKDMGYEISMTMPLGLGGVALSDRHSVETVCLLNDIKPHHVRLLTLMVVPGTPLAEDMSKGLFTPIDSWRSLEELREIVSGIQFPTKLYANHISNYLPVKGRLPEDREKILAEIEAALATRDEEALRPEGFRGL